MRTYLPYADFAKCAACFSNRRLNKQRHDALEILYMIHDIPHPTRGRQGFYNSPPKKCWQNYVGALAAYGLALCAEWSARNEKPDPCRDRFERYAKHASATLPPWLNDPAMHRSHQAVLARQEPEHYRDFVADPEDEKVFYWPNVDVDDHNGDGGNRRTNPYNRDDSDCLDSDTPPDDYVEGCECEACDYARTVYGDR